MSTVELKYSLFKTIDSIDDSRSLKDIFLYIKERISPAKDIDLRSEFSDEQIAEIEESIAEADRGEVIPHEQAMKEIRSRYKK